MLSIMLPEERLPWSGPYGAWPARRAVLERIRQAGMTIVFVNTRAQAELMFQALWRINSEATLPIAIHHGSAGHQPAPPGRGGDVARDRDEGEPARGDRNVIA